MGNPSEIVLSQELLRRLLQKNADERALSWLVKQEEKLRHEFSDRSFYLAFSSVPRFVAQQPLALLASDREEAQQLRTGFQADHWSLRQTVRAYLLLFLPETHSEVYLATLVRLLETADADEQAAIYQSLPLLRYPEALVALATNGLRTNITSVFDAIALRNPYPADYLDEAAWNQLVLKAVFMERPLYLIYDADARANPTLARILVDFAHERWAASRPVTPELWRFTAPYLEASHQSDIERVLASDNVWERAAGVLACQQSSQLELQSLAKSASTHLGDIAHTLSWHHIGEAHAAGG